MTQMEAKQSTMTFGLHWSHGFYIDPKRLAFVLTRYQVAADMHPGGPILELGCSEGIGVPTLTHHGDAYTGVDYDHEALGTARQTYAQHRFIHADFMGQTFGCFEMVVSLDVVEHIYPQDERSYFDTVWRNTSPSGVAVIGTPNISSQVHASRISQLAHVNLFDPQRLQRALASFFHHVFCFGLNDEVLHTGFGPMSHYIVCLACQRRDAPHVGD